MKLFKPFVVILIALNTVNSVAAVHEKNSASVDKLHCKMHMHATAPFVLILDRDDRLLESINQCVQDAKLMGASIAGLGQLQNPVLAYFTSNANEKPTFTKFNGIYELAGLHGNVTNNNGKYYTHLHGVLADKKFNGLAGHIKEATVGITAEITIIPLSASLERTVNPKTGFGPIVH